MSLIVTNLGCQRSGRNVLSGLDLEVAPGETLLLRGPNGVGKSTLLRVLAGLLPASGNIALDGVSRTRDPDAYDERVAYAGHLDAIKPQLTVAENLRFWCALFGGPGIAAALAAFDLGAIAERPAHACSAGQKRRLGLARLLLAPRRLWLLDEPTVSLDAAAVERFRDALQAHCAAGGLALVATHVDLGHAPSRTLDLAGSGARDGPGDPMLTDPFLAGSFA